MSAPEIVQPGQLGGALAPALPAEVTLLQVIARASSDPNTNVEKLQQLMDLYERVLANEARRAYTAALAEMQPELPVIEEHGEIHDKQGNVQSKYALWEDVNDAIKPVLARHGFSLTFGISQGEGRINVTGKLSHREGHVEETTMSLPLDTSGNKNSVQSYGSSVSYGQRYAARALLNLTSRGDDDDGVAGGTSFIDPAELEALQLLAEKAGADVRRFCEHLKVPSLDQLPKAKLRIAERLLQDKIARETKPTPPREPEPLREPSQAQEPHNLREPGGAREPSAPRDEPPFPGDLPSKLL